MIRFFVISILVNLLLLINAIKDHEIKKRLGKGYQEIYKEYFQMKKELNILSNADCEVIK